MVYNKSSWFYHAHVGYVLRFRQGRARRIHNTDTLFQKSTDGKKCPISRAYLPREVIELCEQAGFRTAFLGGYPSATVELFSGAVQRIKTKP